jgi:DNA replication protein DnaC
MNVNNSLPEDLQLRLERMKANPALKRAGASICALTKNCPKCSDHRGIFLDGTAATVKARPCDCVMSCGICSGSSMLPSADGVKSCASLNPRKISSLINEAKIPSRYISADISSFKGFGPQDRSQTVISSWLKNLKPGQSSGLLFSGPVGMGKSWLLAAIAKRLALMGISVRYADFFQLVHELRDAYATEQADKSSLRPLQNVEVLIIDELGKGRNSEWELSVADSLISERYNSNKCMIAATNYPLRGHSSEIAKRQTDYLMHSGSTTNQMNANSFEPLSERIGSRMFSRLTENCICLEVNGPDRRRQ